MVTFVNFESLWPKFERRSFSKAIIFSSFVLSIILNKYSIFSTRRKITDVFTYLRRKWSLNKDLALFDAYYISDISSLLFFCCFLLVFFFILVTNVNILYIFIPCRYILTRSLYHNLRPSYIWIYVLPLQSLSRLQYMYFHGARESRDPAKNSIHRPIYLHTK